MKLSGVCLSVCLSYLAPQPWHAAGLLLWALRAGDIDRLLHASIHQMLELN